MSKNNKLEKAYRDLQMQEVPDLWNRIESNLASQPKHCEVIGKRRRRNWLGSGLAAACAAVIAVGAWRGIGLWEQKTASMETATAGEKAAEAAETMEDRTEAQTSFSADGQTSEGSVGQMAAQAKGAHKILQYDSLSLMGTKAYLPPGETNFVSEDQRHFTEELLRDTVLLTEACVEAVSYEKDQQGRINQVIYEIKVQRVLYSEDYVSEGQKLLVESPLTGNGAEVLYEMKEGGTYILPLKAGERAYGLIFPYGPQIEVTKDQGYVFHNGFRSLVNEETSVVIMGEHGPEDYYYDRMVFRDDTVFLSNLTQLVETKRKEQA